MQDSRRAVMVHSIPGRIRFRLDSQLRAADSMKELVTALSQVPGIKQVQCNPKTGSLLVLYEPDTFGIEDLMMAAQAANVVVTLPDAEIAAASSGAEISRLAASINRSAERADRALSAITRGAADLKTLVPIGLAAVALRQIASSGVRLTSVPWYVLLWYSWGIFNAYNRKNQKQSTMME